MGASANKANMMQNAVAPVRHVPAITAMVASANTANVMQNAVAPVRHIPAITAMGASANTANVIQNAVTETEKILNVFVMDTKDTICFSDTSAEITLAAIVSAAAGAVSAGSSLTGKTLSNLMNPNCRVNCGMEVENWARFPLTNPVVNIFAGALFTPRGHILLSSKEAVVARKTSDTATGTFGTVSWLVEGQDRRIVLMWAAPYDFIFHSNWLGVGITTRGKTLHALGNEWFNRMYYGKSSNSLGFSRSEYYWEANPVIYNDLIQMSGTMSTGYQEQVKITVRPVKVSDLAALIKALLEK